MGRTDSLCSLRLFLEVLFFVFVGSFFRKGVGVKKKQPTTHPNGSFGADHLGAGAPGLRLLPRAAGARLRVNFAWESGSRQNGGAAANFGFPLKKQNKGSEPGVKDTTLEIKGGNLCFKCGT